MLFGLKQLEKLGVIHCDLKPENVLWKDNTHKKLKIIDFGSSCWSNKPGFTYVQSRFYRCPEIVLGLGYGTPADMWSVGCILYEIITGRPLFPA